MTKEILGHYELLDRLGEGGMGEVWKAYDPKLQRTVAIKVLHETDDASNRILAEARAASGLSHPNICVIHEVSEADGQSFIVMEHVEGKPLSELIPSDGLPLESVIRYGTQIADALAHAHEHGIVHRDLKSANVVITPEAQVKLIDFGIAVPLAKVDADAVTRTMESPVSSAPVGTLAYMAPEVLNGQEATARSDIWSLGVLLYEMASGRLPFEGESPLDVVSAIAKETPRALPSRVSAGFRSVVQRCLQKEPGSRYASPAIVQGALETIQSDTFSVPSTRRPRAWLARWPVAAGAAVVVGAIGLSWLGSSDTSDPASPASVPRLSSPTQVSRGVEVDDVPAWSRDGRSVAYERKSADARNSDIWIVQVGSAQPLNRTSDHPGRDRSPSWSPDGREIAFFSDRDGSGLFVMPTLAGVPRRVASIDGIFGESTPQWSSSGDELAYVVFSSDGAFNEVVTLATGEARRLATPSDGNFGMDLAWSPDDQYFAFVAGNHTSDVAALWVLRAGDGEATRITDGRWIDQSPTWSADSRSLFFVSNRGGAMDLWRQRLTDGRRPDGPPTEITVGVGIRHATFSSDGTRLAYSRGGLMGTIWRVPLLDDRVATWSDAEQITFEQDDIKDIDLSPDGTQLVASSNRSGNFDLWIGTVATGDMRQLTNDPTPDVAPKWSPDGQTIAFQAFRSGNRDIWLVPAQGGAARQLTTDPSADWHPAWSPDGQRIAFRSNRSDPSRDLWVVSADGGAPSQVTDTDVLITGWPTWSADGRSLVVSSGGRLWHVPASGGDLTGFIVGEAGGDPPELGEPGAEGSLDALEYGTPEMASTQFWNLSRLTEAGQFYFGRGSQQTSQLWVASADDGREQLLAELGGRRGSFGAAGPFATDGTYLYFVWREESGDIWVMDVVQDEE